MGTKKEKVNRHCIRLPGVGPTDWIDCDEMMFLACFAILGRFVEEELGTNTKPWADSKNVLYRGYRRHSADGRDERAIDLWLWYKNELPKEKRKVEEDWRSRNVRLVELGRSPHGGVEVTLAEDRPAVQSVDHLSELKDRKLRELMDLRGALWT